MALHRFVHSLHPTLSWVLGTLSGTPLGQALEDRVTDLLAQTAFEEQPNYEEVLAAHLWFLRRASETGFPLTAAGYLKPADVKEFGPRLPEMAIVGLPFNREVNARPILNFRTYLRELRLVRTNKGVLTTTKLGNQLAENPAELWKLLADTLLPDDEEFDTSARLLVLVHAATQPDGRVDRTTIARTLTELGWRHVDLSPVRDDEFMPVEWDVWTAIGNIGSRPKGDLLDRTLSPAASLLIRDTLFGEISREQID